MVYHSFDDEHTGQIYQLYDFVVLELECNDSTVDLPVSVSYSSAIQSCSVCNSHPNRWTSASQSCPVLRDRCLHCQFFCCESCCNSKLTKDSTLPLAASLHLPPFHLYFCSSYHSAGSFIVIRFREGKCEKVHPDLESLLCSCEEKPILFVYLPQSLQNDSSVCAFLEALPCSQHIVIPITNQSPSLLRLECNQLLKMQHSLPYSLPFPPLRSPLLFPLSSPVVAENIAPSCVSIPLQSQPLSEAEKLVIRLHRPLSSPMQHLSLQQKKVVAGAGFVVTQQMNGSIDWYYIPPHYAESDERTLLEHYKHYQ